MNPDQDDQDALRKFMNVIHTKVLEINPWPDHFPTHNLPPFVKAGNVSNRSVQLPHTLSEKNKEVSWEV